MHPGSLDGIGGNVDNTVGMWHVPIDGGRPSRPARRHRRRPRSPVVRRASASNTTSTARAPGERPDKLTGEPSAASTSRPRPPSIIASPNERFAIEHAPVDRAAAATISPSRPKSASPNSRMRRLGQARGRIRATARAPRRPADRDGPAPGSAPPRRSSATPRHGNGSAGGCRPARRAHARMRAAARHPRAMERAARASAR